MPITTSSTLSIDLNEGRNHGGPRKNIYTTNQPHSIVIKWWEVGWGSVVIHQNPVGRWQTVGERWITGRRWSLAEKPHQSERPDLKSVIFIRRSLTSPFLPVSWLSKAISRYWLWERRDKRPDGASSQPMDVILMCAQCRWYRERTGQPNPRLQTTPLPYPHLTTPHPSLHPGGLG